MERRLVRMDRSLGRRWGQRAADYAAAVRGQTLAWVSREQPGVLAAGDPEKPLLVLIPGVYDSWRFMLPLARKLNRHGYRVLPLPGLGDNRRPVMHGARLLSAELERIAAQAGSGTERVVLVAHSKGGLIGKQVLLDFAAGQTEPDAAGGRLAVLGMVAVATPFQGSRYAARAVGRTLREFRPDSETIRALAAQAEVNSRIVSVLPSFDPHIPGDRTLPGAAEFRLHGSGHFRILASQEGLAAVLAGVESLQ